MRALLVAVAAGLLAEEPAHTLVIAAIGSHNIAPPPPPPNPGNPYVEVSATPASKHTAGGVVSEGKYLIASFPHLKQVAYCILPDNVWRPLVIGDLTSPKGVAVDAPNHQLFVADPAEGKVYKYKLLKKADGKLETDNQQLVALDGFTVNWMTVSGIGDLYFTGKATVDAPQSSYDAVFRLDGALIAKGSTLTPTEIYTRSNSGNPFPKVWMPSGLAVDSFYIYWGNQEAGSSYGSIVKGNRQNVGGRSTSFSLLPLSTAQDEVRGMTITGTALYYLTTKGVYGVSKGQATTVTDAADGLIASPPSADLNDNTFDPKSIAWDGGGTAYFTDFTTGAVYSFPANDLRKHNLTKFVDAPGVHGMSVLVYETSSGGNGRSRGKPTLLTGMLLMLWCAFGAFAL